LALSLDVWLTAAIRFTASSNVRKITVTYDVSFVPPAEDTCALPSSIALPEEIPPKEDTPMWLFVSVRDTGPGLGPKELAMLFKRFSRELQVDCRVKTHRQRGTR
jgi:signal transduction histidine kinase